MGRRLSLIIILGLLCFNTLTNYFWSKKLEILDKEVAVFIQSNENAIRTINDRLNDLCGRLTRIEKRPVEESSSGTHFKIVEDKG